MNTVTCRAGFAAIAIAPLVALLVACAPAAAPAPVTPAMPSTPAAPVVKDSGTAVGFTCDEALPPAALSGLPGAWAPEAGYTPTANSGAARAAAMNGIACGYLNTSGQLLEVGIALPSADTLASIKTEVAASSTATSAFGTTGFFTAGEAEVFPGSYWITAKSPAFGTDKDATTIVSMAVQVLPAG